MNVQLVYRNYKPLHDLYRSFLIEPPPHVSFEIPRPMRMARRLYPLYLAFGDWASVRSLMSIVQDVLFGEVLSDRADLVHFIQIVPRRIPQKPYVVDFEHAAALANFVRLDEAKKNHILGFLRHENCRRIIPLTQAAKQSLLAIYPDLHPDIRAKVKIIYPALPDYAGRSKGRIEASGSSRKPGTLKFLFVGNDVYRKGLHELMHAFRELQARHPDIELHVVSDAPPALKREYASPKIWHFDPIYTFDEMIEKFYLTCDVLVLPTHCDTFGMAILNALSCGKPVVTTGQFAARELVRDGENGFIVRSQRLLLNEVCAPDRAATKTLATRNVDPLLVEELVEKMYELDSNRHDLTRMSQEARKDFMAGGKFSVYERNRNLQTVYSECLHSR